MHNDRVISFDLFRGLAALAVCAGHLRAVMFENGSAIDYMDLGSKVFYLLTSLGHESVIVFFVLSGYFVGGSVVSKLNRFSFKGYILSRCIRLLVVLVPAILFTSIFDYLISQNTPELLLGFFRNVINLGPEVNAYDNSLLVALGNFLFLQTILVPVFGSNSVLWSIANEFWYYILFPVTLFVFVSDNMFKRTIFFILSLIILYMLISVEGMLIGYFIWIFGVFTYILLNKYNFNSTNEFFKSPLFFFLSLFTFLSIIVAIKLFIKNSSISDIVLGISFVPLLIMLKNNNIFKYNCIFVISDFLSKISYTLYLFHFPLVLLVYSLFFTELRFQPTFSNYIIYLFSLLFIIVFSYCMWICFESKTDNIKSVLKKYV